MGENLAKHKTYFWEKISKPCLIFLGKSPQKQIMVYKITKNALSGGSFKSVIAYRLVRFFVLLYLGLL